MVLNIEFFPGYSGIVHISYQASLDLKVCL